MNKENSKIEAPKQITLNILKVEDTAIIVNVGGWRMRVYIDKLNKEDKGKLGVGQEVVVEYTGELKDVHSIKLLPLTKLN